MFMCTLAVEAVGTFTATVSDTAALCRGLIAAGGL